MRRGLTFTFIFGLLIGGLVGLLLWYYQKSTSSEDGALVLLDKLADADRRLRELTAVKGSEALASIQVKTEEIPTFLKRPLATAEADDLTQVKGIGPVFANRLHEANIRTIQALAAVSPQRLAKILQISEARAENILNETSREANKY